MPKCPKCKSLYGIGDHFCPECGEKFRESNFLNKFLILIAVAMIIGVVLFFALKTSKTNSINSAEPPTTMSTSIPTDEEEISINEEMLRELQSQYEYQRDLLRERFMSIEDELQIKYESERDLLRERLSLILDEIKLTQLYRGVSDELIDQAEQEEIKLRELYFEKIDELIDQAEQEEIKLTKLYEDRKDELISQTQYNNEDLIRLYEKILEELSTQAHEGVIRLIDLYGDVSEELSTQAHEGVIRLIGLYEKLSEEYEKCVDITNFHFNAVGDDNYNLNDEYVTFKNKCSYSIDMTSWTVRDENAYHVYTFPSFTFEGGTTFTLYTGTGINTNSALYWGRTPGDYAAIWNNQGGDTLFLRDSNRNLVLSQSYAGY